MRKLAKILGALVIFAALSGCSNGAAPQTPPRKTLPDQQPTAQQQTSTDNLPVTQTATSDIPEIKSNNPDIKEMNNLAKDIDGLDRSAQGLNENQDLSAE